MEHKRLDIENPFRVQFKQIQSKPNFLANFHKPDNQNFFKHFSTLVNIYAPISKSTKFKTFFFKVMQGILIRYGDLEAPTSPLMC